jgi:hypothetical protein
VFHLRASCLLTDVGVADHVDRYLDILAEKQKWLEQSFASVDPAALEGGFYGGRYWAQFLDNFGDNRIALLPQLLYYMRRGRFKLANQ